MNGSPVNCLHSQGNHHEGILHCFVIQMHSQLVKRLLHLEEKKLPWIPNKPWGAAIFWCCSHVQYFFWFQSVPPKHHPTCVRISVAVSMMGYFFDGKKKSGKLTSWGKGSLSPSIYRILYIPSGCFFSAELLQLSPCPPERAVTRAQTPDRLVAATLTALLMNWWWRNTTSQLEKMSKNDWDWELFVVCNTVFFWNMTGCDVSMQDSKASPNYCNFTPLSNIQMHRNQSYSKPIATSFNSLFQVNVVLIKVFISFQLLDRGPAVSLAPHEDRWRRSNLGCQSPPEWLLDYFFRRESLYIHLRVWYGGGSKMDLWSHAEWTNSTERDAPVRLLDLSKTLELQGMPTNFVHQEVRAPVFSSTCLKAAAISWTTDDQETTHEWHTNTYQEIGRHPHPGLKLWKETCDWRVPNLVRKRTLQAQNTQTLLRIQRM